jgi:hypothetical protein
MILRRSSINSRCACADSARFSVPAPRRTGHAEEVVDKMLDQAARNGTVMGLLFSGGSQGHLELNDLEAVSIEDSELAVTESSRRGGDRDPSGARVGAILQALIAREPVQHRPTIRAWLPHGFVAPQVTRDCRATTCCTGVQTLSDACTVGRRVHKRATRAANRGQSFATALLVWCCTKLSNVCRARSPAQSSVVVSPRKGDGTIGNSKTRRQARSELLPAADRGFGGNGARQRARPLCSSAQTVARRTATITGGREDLVAARTLCCS